MGNENEKNQQNPGSNRTILETKSTLTGKIRHRAERMSTTRRIRPRRSLARTAARPIVRTVKGLKMLKSAAHPNRDRGQRTQATANCRGFSVRGRRRLSAERRDADATRSRHDARRLPCYNFFLFHLPGLADGGLYR